LLEAFAIRAEGKVAQARALAEAAQAVVVAKGPDTVIAAPDGRTVFAPSPTSWLAVAGTGDVLAGATASRMAAAHDPFAAACEAVWLHGEAAWQAGPAFLASELAKAISGAYAAAL
jgi:NAD(P)H-hydrate repair Nnr-like enzyme with NAD(P)H-hydrate dehydratase domain